VVLTGVGRLWPLHRADLQEVLYDEARRRGVVSRLGCPVVAIDEDENSLAVVVKGGERIEADVIVGADGKLLMKLFALRWSSHDHAASIGLMKICTRY
jgi:flavin-dependent dehydrogenase